MDSSKEGKRAEEVIRKALKEAEQKYKVASKNMVIEKLDSSK